MGIIARVVSSILDSGKVYSIQKMVFLEEWLITSGICFHQECNWLPRYIIEMVFKVELITVTLYMYIYKSYFAKFHASLMIWALLIGCIIWKTKCHRNVKFTDWNRHHNYVLNFYWSFRNKRRDSNYCVSCHFLIENL